jgi:hypothetical protein
VLQDGESQGGTHSQSDQASDYNEHYCTLRVHLLHPDSASKITAIMKITVLKQSREKITPKKQALKKSLNMLNTYSASTQHTWKKLVCLVAHTDVMFFTSKRSQR